MNPETLNQISTILQQNHLTIQHIVAWTWNLWIISATVATLVPIFCIGLWVHNFQFDDVSVGKFVAGILFFVWAALVISVFLPFTLGMFSTPEIAALHAFITQ